MDGSPMDGVMQHQHQSLTTLLGAKGYANHAAASQRGGAAGDAERFGSGCWPGRRGVGHCFRVCDLDFRTQLIRCNGCGRICLQFCINCCIAFI